MIQGSELDFGVVLICLSKLAKNSFSLNRIPREFLFERNGSLFPFQWSGTVSLHRLTKLAVIRPFAPSDARAPFQFVPFGRFVSVTNCDREKRKRRVQLAWNEHLHKNGGGYPHHFGTLLRVSTMGRHIGKALRGVAYASRVLREEIAF